MVSVRPRTVLAPPDRAWFSEPDRRSDRGLDERLRHRPGEGVNGPPAGAMERHDNAHVQLDERRDGRADDWLEQPAREVQAADKAGDPALPGHPLGIANDVHAPRVRAPRHDDE